ncbi:zinc ribbon domain-containing protein [Micromonospora sediminicola]|uniref:zinc ribbon domain-containing protein n=1 Tax=Micromonospora sediminicola TaxID=946078 RepID=UPI0033DA688B
MCSDCGRISEKMARNVRAWACPCGATHHRDVNAAKSVNAAGQADFNAPGEGAADRNRPGSAERRGNPHGRHAVHAQRGGPPSFRAEWISKPPGRG